MGWLNIAVMVVTCIFKYGPALWELGVKVYKIVEEIKDQFKKENPKATPEAAKAVADDAFDSTLVRAATNSAMAIPAPETRVQLRRDVWATRPENYDKVRRGLAGGGKRPH